MTGRLGKILETAFGAGLLGVDELCAELAKLRGQRKPVSPRTLWNYEAQGMPVHRRGRTKVYVADEVRAWLLGERKRGRPKAGKGKRGGAD